jgi:hypothetical protein
MKDPQAVVPGLNPKRLLHIYVIKNHLNLSIAYPSKRRYLDYLIFALPGYAGICTNID